jgi:peptide deformylase
MIKKVLLWPNPILRTKSEEVDEIDVTRSLTELITDLIDTMMAYGGAGLSAIQIGTALRVFVMKETDGSPIVCINPQIVGRSKEKDLMAEGCLSIPGFYENVMRHIWVDTVFVNAEGKYVTQRFTGVQAQCFQHESDHLNGRMYPDRMDPGAKDRLRAYLRKNTGLFHSVENFLTLGAMIREAAGRCPSGHQAAILLDPTKPNVMTVYCQCGWREVRQLRQDK